MGPDPPVRANRHRQLLGITDGAFLHPVSIVFYRGTSPIKKCPPPEDPPRVLGIGLQWGPRGVHLGLQWGPRGVRFVISEVPPYPKVEDASVPSREQQPSTPNPQPFTLNPSLSTLHPQPYALNPARSTLLPQPYTLNPTPSSLHPQPYTLNPTA